MPESCLAAAGERSGDDGRHRDQLQSQRLSYRVATHADVCEYFGRLPRRTLRAMVVLLDGHVAGIIGLERGPSSVQIFSEYKPELSPYLSSITVWRAIKAALRMAAECPCPVYAVSSDRRMMERVGFHEVTPGIWRN